MEEDVDLETKPAQVGIFQTSPGHFREAMKYKRYLAPGGQRLKADKGPRKLLGDNCGGAGGQPRVQLLGPTLQPLTLVNIFD